MTAFCSVAATYAFILIQEDGLAIWSVIYTSLTALACIPGMYAAWFTKTVIDEQGIARVFPPLKRKVYDVTWDSQIVAAIINGGIIGRYLGLAHPGEYPTAFTFSMKPLMPVLIAAYVNRECFDDDSVQAIEAFIAEAEDRRLGNRIRKRLAAWWKRTRWAWFGR